MPELYAFFREALRRHPEAALELPNDTYRRYAGGQLPERIQWFLRHPDLMRTLADLADASMTKRGENISLDNNQ